MNINDINKELACRDFWEFASHISTRDEASGEVRKFPDYMYLRGLHSDIERSRETVVLKSRQMMVSWYCVSRQLWRAVKAYWTGGVYGGGMASKREDDAKELLSRFMFMYNSMPAWLKPPILEQNQTTIVFSPTVKVMAFPSSANIGRTFTLSELLLDEAAYLPQAREMWLGLYPTLGEKSKAVLASTPNGKFNIFYDLWSQDNGFTKSRIHYSDHPDRDATWVAKAKRGYTNPEDWEREMELSFAGYAGKRVYGSFSGTTHIREFDIKSVPCKVVYRGWDFGYHFPACVWVMKDDKDVYRVAKELLGKDISIDRFAKQVLDISKAAFSNYEFRDFCDPAGAQLKDTVTVNNEKSSVEVLRNMGINPEFRHTNILEGLEQIRQLLQIRADGNTGLVVSTKCQDIIDGFQGGYHYPDKDVPGEVPEKDGYYDHLMDALRYIVVNARVKPEQVTFPKAFNAGLGFTTGGRGRQVQPQPFSRSRRVG